MATLEELVISLVAETSGLRAELDKATKATDRATDKMEDAIEEFSKNSSKEMSFFQQAMATGIGFLGSQAVLGAFTSMKDTAADLFKTLVTDGVAAAQVQEDAIQALNTQLALSGNYSKEASIEMQEWASTLQQTTKFGDETILNMTALASTFGKSREETMRLVEAATELSAATGMSLESAIKNLGKTYAGMTGELGESLPIIRTLTAEQLKAGGALELITNRFGGSAAAQIKTFSGLTTQMSNTWGDFTEQIGFNITQNQAVLEAMAAVNKEIFGGTKSLEEQTMAYKTLVGEGLVLTIETMAVLTTSLDTLLRVGDMVWNGLKVGVLSFAGAVNSLLSLVGATNEAVTETIDESWNEAIKGVNDAIDGETGLGNVTAKLLEIKDAAQRGLEQVKKGADAAVEPVNAAAGAVAELTAEQIKQNEAIKAFAMGLAERGAAAQSQYEFELALLDSNLAAKQIAEEEYFEARLAMLEEQQILENEQLATAREQGLITEQQFNDAKTELARKQALDSKKLNDQQLKYEETVAKQRIANLGSTLSTISSLSSSGNRELAAIGKAAAISTATIDGIAAVQKALASAPPPFNFALAAAVGAATAANVAKIAGVGLNKGGTIAGGGANQDTVPATLTKGETVISRDLTDMLRLFLEKQANGEQKVVVELRMNDSAAEMIEASIVERQAVGRSLIRG